MKKIFNQKSFDYLVWTPLGSRFKIYKFFPSSSLQGASSMVLFQLFTAGINTGGKFATNIVDTGGTPRIFEKIRNVPLGKMIRERNRRKKSRDTVPLIACRGSSNKEFSELLLILQ
jgi:hypothetical protein